MNDLTEQLYQAWQQAIVAGEITNQFQAPQTDSQGRWQVSDRIIYGLRDVAGSIQFYAHNLSQGQDIPDAFEEQLIGSTNFICQFNGYRALRPGIKAWQPGRQPLLSDQVQDCQFHCQDPTRSLSLLQRRPLLQLTLDHFIWQAYYNVSPIEKDGHFLWVPITDQNDQIDLPHYPQKLTQEFLHDTLKLFQNLDQTIVFFNSLQAGASVNHIHVQAMYHGQTLALEQAPVCAFPQGHYLARYPTPGLIFHPDDGSDRIFTWVDRLQTAHIPFNLVMISDRIAIFPRNPDHEVVAEFPRDRLAAPAFMGRLITVHEPTYRTISADKMAQAFSKMGLPQAHFEQLIAGH